MFACATCFDMPAVELYAYLHGVGVPSMPIDSKEDACMHAMYFFACLFKH